MFQVVTKELKTSSEEGLKGWEIALIVVGVLVSCGFVLCKIRSSQSCNDITYCSNCHWCHTKQGDTNNVDPARDGTGRSVVPYDNRMLTTHSATDGPVMLTANNVLAYSRHDQAIFDEGEQGLRKEERIITCYSRLRAKDVTPEVADELFRSRRAYQNQV